MSAAFDAWTAAPCWPISGPQPGDQIEHHGIYYGAKEGQRATIDSTQYYSGCLMAVFGASAHESESGSISCSGGPCPAIPAGELIFGGLCEAKFWRWNRYGRGKGNGEDFKRIVRRWIWIPSRSH